MNDPTFHGRQMNKLYRSEDVYVYACEAPTSNFIAGDSSPARPCVQLHVHAPQIVSRPHRATSREAWFRDLELTACSEGQLSPVSRCTFINAPMSSA